MKLINTENQLEINTGGISSVFAGIIVALLAGGIAIMLVVLGKDTTTKLFAIAPGLFVLIGIAMVLFATKSRVVIQKGGQTTFTETRILGGKSKETHSFPTDSITGVELISGMERRQTSSSIDSDTERTDLSLVLNTGEKIAINTNKKSAKANTSEVNGIPIGMIFSTVKSIFGKPPMTNEANQIAAFLGVPLNSHDFNSLGGIAKEIMGATQHQETNEQLPIQPIPSPAQAPATPLGSSALPEASAPSSPTPSPFPAPVPPMQAPTPPTQQEVATAQERTNQFPDRIAAVPAEEREVITSDKFDGPIGLPPTPQQPPANTPSPPQYPPNSIV